MGDRLKQLRKALQLTQQEFADKIGVSRNNIATYETDKSRPGEAVITLIVRAFNVNEVWLRTGDGEMFTPVTRDEEIAQFAAAVITDDGSFRQRFVAMLTRLDVDDWAVLEKMALMMAEKKEKD